MTNQVTKIELVSQLGTFTFQDKHNNGDDFYNALCVFEQNNWEMLGEVYYLVHETFEDVVNGGQMTNQTKIDGINASAELACYFDEDVADEINGYYQSQH